MGFAWFRCCSPIANSLSLSFNWIELLCGWTPLTLIVYCFAVCVSPPSCLHWNCWKLNNILLWYCFYNLVCGIFFSSHAHHILFDFTFVLALCVYFSFLFAYYYSHISHTQSIVYATFELNLCGGKVLAVFWTISTSFAHCTWANTAFVM